MSMPWWGWATVIWIACIAIYLAKSGMDKKQIEKEVKSAIKEAKKSKGRVKVTTVEREAKKAPAAAKAVASGGGGSGGAGGGAGATPAATAADEKKSDSVRLRQGDLPLPPGQYEYRLVRALDGDKIKCEILLSKELERVPHQTREEAAAGVLAELRGSQTFSSRPA